MFEDSMIESAGKKETTKRWLTFPLSSTTTTATTTTGKEEIEQKV